MSLRKSIKRATRRVTSQVSRTVDQAGDQLERTRDQAKDAYRRYKEPLITIGGAVLGGVLGSVVPVIGTTAGAMLGASLASGARSGYANHVDAGKQKAENREYEASMGNNNDLIAALKRRRVQRGAGEGVAEFETDAPTTGADAQNVMTA